MHRPPLSSAAFRPRPPLHLVLPPLSLAVTHCSDCLTLPTPACARTHPPHPARNPKALALLPPSLLPLSLSSLLFLAKSFLPADKLSSTQHDSITLSQRQNLFPRLQTFESTP